MSLLSCRRRTSICAEIFYLNISGCNLFHCVASWYTLPNSSMVASSYNFPIRVMLVGKLSLVKPVGTHKTGIRHTAMSANAVLYAAFILGDV